MSYLRQSDEIAEHRQRTVFSCLAVAALCLALVAWVPLPSSTRTEGVVRPAVQSALHSPSSGRIVDLSARAGDMLSRGDVVLGLAAPELSARLRVLNAEIMVLETRRQSVLRSDPAEARRIASDLAQARREHDVLARQESELLIRSDRTGRFVPVDTAVVIGRPVERGELLGHLIGDDARHVAAVVEQNDIGRVKGGVLAASVRLAERPAERLDAAVISDTPKGDRRLPSRALAYDGTRGIAVASSTNGMEALEPVFHLELGLPADVNSAAIGGRAFVTLVHEPESLGRRWWRSVRQLFLARLSV